jgi:hypothetical protein
MDQMANLLEALTIFCFGLSWPISIRKSWISGTAKGKSLLFLCLILFGYVAGIASKFMNEAYMAAFTEKWYVLVFYILNFVMVAADLCLYFRNRALDKKREAATA